MCYKLLKKHLEHIDKIKKQRNIAYPVLKLLVAGIIFLIAAATGGSAFSMLPPLGMGWPTAMLIVFLVVFFGGLFAGLLVEIIMVILGGNGKYFEGLVPVAYSLLPFSVGILLVSIFNYIPYVGTVLSFLAISLFGVFAYATLFRTTKELFKTDMITAFVGVSVLTAIIVMSFYVVMMFSVAQLGVMPGLVSY